VQVPLQTARGALQLLVPADPALPPTPLLPPPAPTAFPAVLVAPPPLDDAEPPVAFAPAIAGLPAFDDGSASGDALVQAAAQASTSEPPTSPR
jgi:hypothetical protein